MNNDLLYSKIRILKIHKIYGNYIYEMMKCGENLNELRSIIDGVEASLLHFSFEWNHTFHGSSYWSYINCFVRYSLKTFLQTPSLVDINKRRLQTLNRKRI